MRYQNVAIPAGMAWSSPFAKWQGSLGACKLRCVNIFELYS
jgi:hypothetical protein